MPSPQEFLASPIIFGIASVALFSVSAKAHGRQIRIERERQGHSVVSFQDRQGNPPFVQDLWKRDRVLYWCAAVAFAVVGTVAAVVTYRALDWRSLAVVVFALAGGFLVAGVSSLARTHRTPSKVTVDATRGTMLWWTLVAAAWMMWILPATVAR